MNNKSIYDFQIESLVLGGEGIRTSNYQTICAAGFWVRSRLNSTKYYIMTAGHCHDNGPFNTDGSVDFYHFPWLGSLVNDVAPGFIGQMAQPDLSVVDKGLILKQSDLIGVTASVRNSDNPDYQELFIYGTGVIDTVKSIVCKSGYFSHVQCGHIQATDASFYFIKDDEVVEYRGLTKVDKIGFQGDSGAPVFGYELSLMPGIIIAGMLSSGNLLDDWNTFTPIDVLITDDIDIITVNDL
ncbi:hypothetical protein F8M41_003613 [Gigaspora margarita]|uniref:Serine protease n=1 Tax=Gigaspora margarita TaxID=4874 RepID=A0A8H4A7C0_GIGMA|nr:hypothetical protein F8M41_003613 [Gigaspora margarita]